MDSTTALFESMKMHTCYLLNAFIFMLQLMFVLFGQELLSRQIAAEEQEKSVLKDLNRRIFARFSAE
jgi:hypothetical protein